MNTLDTKRAIKKGRELQKRNRLYTTGPITCHDVAIKPLLAIEKKGRINSEELMQITTKIHDDSFSIGFLQGYKAAWAEMKKKLQQ